MPRDNICFEWYGGLFETGLDLYVSPLSRDLYEDHYRFLLKNISNIEKNKIFESKICDIKYFIVDNKDFANIPDDFIGKEFLKLEDKFWEHRIAQLPMGGR